jgi:pilus assembly protein CpaC
VSEPLLTAVSGEAATFLVGGNLPIPVTTILPGTPTQNALIATNVAFIEFGLRIVARPTVLENGRIGIVLDQILTEPDDTAAIVLNGARIPGFKQRSVRTVTESFDAETWAVAGLVADTDTRSAAAVPLLSRIPMLGVLFRNRSEEKTRSELIVTITARKVPERSEPRASAVEYREGEKR